MAFSSPTDAYTAVDLAPRIPELWPPLIQEELFPKTVAANWFTDLSDMMGEGDIANIADIYTNSLSVQTQSTQANAVVDASVAQQNVQLTVDTHEYIAVIIGDKDARQLLNSFNFNEVYARKMAGTLRDSIEDSLFALWSGLSANTAVGDTATVLTDLEIRQAIRTLHNQNFELNDIGFFFHPTVYWDQVQGIQKYYDASMRGTSPSSTVTGNFTNGNPMSGNFGDLYGMPIFVTPNVVSGLQTYRNLLAHREAFGFANQTPGNGGSNNVRVQAEYQLQNLGTLVVVDVLYGVAELRDQAAVVVNANTSATTA